MNSGIVINDLNGLPLREPSITTCVAVANGEAKLKVVKTGIQDDTNIEIISGLNEGDEIITGPYNMVSKTLKPGDKIEKKNKKDKKEDESSED